MWEDFGGCLTVKNWWGLLTGGDVSDLFSFVDVGWTIM